MTVTEDGHGHGDARYGCPRTVAPGVTFYGSCSYHGRSSWGWRLTCEGCGADESCPVGSSVAHEDAPGHFAREHRGCNPDTESARVTVAHDVSGRVASRSYLYFDVPTLRRACELATDRLKATCATGRVEMATFDF
jgi:hypothetical protein